MLWGDNGAGKTAILEAICVLARGRSFRNNPLDALVNAEADYMTIFLDILDARGASSSFSCAKKEGESVVYRSEGNLVRRGSSVSRALSVQIVTPDESNLIFSGPAIRRTFVDWGLFHVEHGYLELARKYNKTLRQRNAWIKAATSGPDPWLRELASLGSHINRCRGQYISRISDLMSSTTFGFLDKLVMEYRGGGVGVDEDRALEILQAQAIHDHKTGYTSLGPHRGDLRITFDQRPAKIYLSRGQAKIASIVFAISQSRLLLDDRSMKSILLVDDIAAELDEDNLMRCLKAISDTQMQSFMTASDPSLMAGGTSYFGESKVFHVKHGQLI